MCHMQCACIGFEHVWTPLGPPCSNIPCYPSPSAMPTNACWLCCVSNPYAVSSSRGVGCTARSHIAVTPLQFQVQQHTVCLLLCCSQLHSVPAHQIVGSCGGYRHRCVLCAVFVVSVNLACATQPTALCTRIPAGSWHVLCVCWTHVRVC
jgi:hypothetical protein